MADQTPPLSAQAVSGAAIPRMSPMALVSLALAILSFACLPIVAVIPAIVCGHIAWSKIRKSGGALRGKEVALAGLIVGYLAVPWAVLQVWFLAGMIQGERGRLHDLAIKRQEISSDNGNLKVTTSGFWVKRTDLNKKASLQAAYKDKEMYLIVITDPKSTAPNMTLEQHHQMTRDHMLQTMKNSSATQSISTSVDGHPAMQDQITGIENGANVVFLHTTVDDGGNYQQIMAWTLKSRWQSHQQELREVTESFHSEK
jgi:hypothetical protein